MAALTAGVNRPGIADPGPGGPPAARHHRTRWTGPSAAVSLRHQDRPVLAAAGPGRPGRGRGAGPAGSASRRRPGSGWSARCRASGLPAPGHVHHPARRRRGVRRVRAARLADRRAPGQRPDPPVRQVVRDLLLRRSAWPDRWPTTCWPRPGRRGRRGPSPRSCPACRSWSWPWGPRWPTCSAPMLAPQRTDRTTGPEDQQYRGPQPGPPRTRQVRPRTRPHPRPLWPGPVLPQGPRRPRGRTTTPGRQHQARGIGQARVAASRLAAAGKPVSRRALRSEGIRGSNQALNALARTINAELAGTAVVPARPGNAMVRT